MPRRQVYELPPADWPSISPLNLSKTPSTKQQRRAALAPDELHPSAPSRQHHSSSSTTLRPSTSTPEAQQVSLVPVLSDAPVDGTRDEHAPNTTNPADNKMTYSSDPHANYPSAVIPAALPYIWNERDMKSLHSRAAHRNLLIHRRRYAVGMIILTMFFPPVAIWMADRGATGTAIKNLIVWLLFTPASTVWAMYLVFVRPLRAGVPREEKKIGQ